METLTEREQVALELLEAEKAFQAVHRAMNGTATAPAYAAARARLERAQLRAEALLARDC